MMDKIFEQVRAIPSLESPRNRTHEAALDKGEKSIMVGSFPY
jgi:hypothetical protein